MTSFPNFQKQADPLDAELVYQKTMGNERFGPNGTGRPGMITSGYPEAAHLKSYGRPLSSND